MSSEKSTVKTSSPKSRKFFLLEDSLVKLVDELRKQLRGYSTSQRKFAREVMAARSQLDKVRAYVVRKSLEIKSSSLYRSSLVDPVSWDKDPCVALEQRALRARMAVLNDLQLLV